MTEEPDLPMAGGRGSDLFTDRIVFYLENRTEIERWASIRSEASAATQQFLTQFQADLEPLADDRGLRLVPFEGVFGQIGYFLASAGSQKDSAEPRLAVAFGWHPRHAVLDEPDDAPFLAVYAQLATDGSTSSLRERFLSAARQLREENGWEGRGSKMWPVWRRVVAAPRWWTDLDAQRLGYRDAVDASLTMFQPAIDEALTSST